MKFYIASKLENAEAVSRVARALKAAGHIHTYDWTVHGSVQDKGEQRIREVAEAEKQGVLDADVVIVILPGGRGTHAELGIALGAGNKEIVICAADNSLFSADKRTCAFYWNTGIHRVTGTEDRWVNTLLKVYGKTTPMSDSKETLTEDEIINLCAQTLGVSDDRLCELARADKADEIGLYRFYYCASEDEYLIGARMDTLYYAKWDGKSFIWSMSRYLPWGEHVVDPATMWKEHTYPSEPQEIGCSEWVRGFLKKTSLCDRKESALPMVSVTSGIMPADGEECIVLTESGTYFSCHYQNGEFGNEEFSFEFDGPESKLRASKWEKITGVIAWMKMPKTPKVGTE